MIQAQSLRFATSFLWVEHNLSTFMNYDLFFSFIRQEDLPLGKHGGKQKVKAAFHLKIASGKIDFWRFLISEGDSIWVLVQLCTALGRSLTSKLAFWYFDPLSFLSSSSFLVMNKMMKRRPPYRWWSWSPWPAPSPPPRPPPPGQRASSSCTPDQQSSWWWWRLWWWWSIDHGNDDDDCDDADDDTARSLLALCICC